MQSREGAQEDGDARSERASAMNDTLQDAQPAVGLCASCRHARRTGNERGSSFWQCLRSQADPEFPRYPRLPVRACRGYERHGATGFPALTVPENS